MRLFRRGRVEEDGKWLCCRKGLRPEHHLYVGVQQHQPPLAVATVDAQGQLYFFKQQYGNSDTFFLVVRGKNQFLVALSEWPLPNAHA